ILQAMQADSGIELKELRVDGGAANNDFLMQFQADILNITIKRPKITETTALGAAYLAGLAVGFWQSEEEISKQWQIDKEFRANMDEVTRAKLLRGWQKALKRSRNWAEE
ncbi:MAG TPA: glycerol kinase, partial [Trueperaceae bacterium]|nr:glycerol kinase [Trueperaceae bacterium]